MLISCCSVLKHINSGHNLDFYFVTEYNIPYYTLIIYNSEALKEGLQKKC